MKISGLMWALLLAWGSADAAGLGKLTVQSALGQPLRAEIELLSVTRDELADISARLASPEAYRQARVDRLASLGGLNFTVEQSPKGQPLIRITSSAAIPDPFLEMLIELNWSSGRLIREYTILLDPPTESKPAEPSPRIAAPEAGRIGAARTGAQAAPATAVEPAGKPKAAQSPAPAAPKRYGPVRSGETLRGIAAKVKPAEISLEQMMLGLYQANKNAFQDNNMNRLSRGQVLAVPDAETVGANSRAEALRVIRGHVTEWQAYRQKVAEMSGEVARPGAEAKPATGKIAARTDERVAAPGQAPKDVLKLSKGEPGSAGKPDARTQEKLQTLEEELAAKARALQEAQDRVGQLERTVRDMQSLLELKAQDAAKAAAPAAPAKPETAPAATESAPAAAPPKPAAIPAPLPAAEPDTSWFSTFISNPIYIGGFVAAALLSALLWMMMMGSRRRQGLTKFEDSIMTGGEFKNNAVFNPQASSAGAGVSTEGSMLLTDFSRLGMGAIDSHEVDPIAEAEVYMAYGRDAQAEEILKEALSKDPSRHEIALKLLEIYAARKDTVAFETVASELYAGLSGQNTPIWQRAAEMGRTIDLDNPLYRVQSAETAAGFAIGAAAVTAVAAAAPVAEAAPVQADTRGSSGLEGLEDLGSLDDWAPPATEAAATSTLEFAPATESDWSDEAAAALAESTPITATAADENILEFDSASEFAAAEAEMVEIPEMTEAPEMVEAVSEAAEPEPDLMSIPETTTLELPQQPDAPEEAGDVALDLDLPVIELEAAEAEMPVLDLSDIDLELKTEDFDATTPEVTEAQDFLAEPAELELPEAAPDFVPATPAAEIIATVPDMPPEETAAVAEASLDQGLREEVNTKLDLARAYLEMGDREGAREILQEVINEGDAQQKADADKLMAEAS